MSHATKPTTWQKIAWTFTDTLVVTKRNLIRYRRVPRLVIFSSIQPIMFLLLFNYVFGGAIRLPPGIENYTNFLMAGIVIQTVLFGSSFATISMAEDLESGLIDRLRSLPMSRVAVLAGRVLADTVRNLFVVLLMIAVGYIIGFRFQAGLGSALIAILLPVLFGFAFLWISVMVGLIAKDPETAQAAGFVWIFPLVFASSVFVPPSTMPDWLRTFAENQPVSLTANTIRSFMLGGDHPDLGLSLLWMLGIAIVFGLISVRLYMRTSNR